MFFAPERLPVVRRWILRGENIDKVQEFQRTDFRDIFKEMDGLPVTVRLLDPPLHEFLPNPKEVTDDFAETLNYPDAQTLKKDIADMHEENPMLGFRGCRLSVVYPEITEMQVKAIIGAAAQAMDEGYKPLPEIMIPLVINVREIRLISEIIDKSIRAVSREKTVSVPYKVGTMMETPRACLGADRLAGSVEFMSFGTNDLTQMTYGFSRDDAGKFIPQYLDQKLIESDPFVSLDQRAVGRLMEMAVDESRRRKKGIKYGICGEHGGDPRSIQFCHDLGLDYVSCSPFRVPVARIAAAQANVDGEP